VPQRRGSKGRQPTRERLVDGEPKPEKVQKIAKQLDSSQWNHIFIRDTERKELWGVYAPYYLLIFDRSEYDDIFSVSFL